MIIDPIIFITLSLISIVLSIGVVVLVSSYSKILSDQHTKDKELENLKNSISQDGLAVLDQARKKSYKMIEDAHMKASEIIGGATVNTNTSKEELEKELQHLIVQQEEIFKKASHELESSYQSVLEELKKQNADQIKHISEDLEKEAVSEISEFKGVLEKQTVQAEQLVSQKVEQEYQAINKELQEYKDQQFKKIDESIYKVLQEVSIAVIGKSLNLDDQQSIIRHALEEAKKEGDFTHGQ